ncbi:protein containing 4-diphosphocytidyl-2C-methyl-D-erythritol synthase domain protein [human gut metagenome]|uniref:Protein containing 4-diphosphocytidyl-2C-methyl-D-erythritol synthase domain protein n=1 Tax=human gut metagenome TaxID=408170 RepID=K1SWF6_9ZZZZ
MGRDKLMMEVGGVPVLVRSLQAMQNCAAVDELIVVTRTSRLEEIAALRNRYGLTKMTKVVVGGMTRAESSLAGVLAASNRATLIGIHDAARPLVTDDIITETIQAAKKSRAAAPGIPVRDMGYQHAKYMEQIKEVKESNRKTGNYPNPMTKELNDSQKLSPVITLVLNYSQKEWEKPRCLNDMLKFPEDMKCELEPWIPSYSVCVINLASQPETTILPVSIGF